MYMDHTCAWCPKRPEGSVSSPGSGVTGDWEPANGDAEQQTWVSSLPCSASFSLWGEF